MSDKLKKALETIESINSELGDNMVMLLNQKQITSSDVISTGSLGLDLALGVGGLPKGRIIEIFGPESSGKTTVAIHTIAEAQKKNNVCAFIDMEHAFDREYAENLGVDVDRLIVSQPENGEQALQIADKLAKSGNIDVIVVDSVAALVPEKEMNGDVGDSTIGLQARLMGQALRKLTPVVGKNNVLFIFINQIREKIGVMFGSPETTSGGNALKFYASIRLDVRRSLSSDNMVKHEKENIGNLTTVKVIKNKVAPPFKKTEFNIIWGQGIDKIGEYVSIGKNVGILKKHGDKITYNEEKYTVNQFLELINDNEEFKEELIKKIREASQKNTVEETVQE